MPSSPLRHTVDYWGERNKQKGRQSAGPSVGQSPCPGTTYEVHVVADGRLKFIPAGMDLCELRSAVLQGFGNDDVEFKPAP